MTAPDFRAHCAKLIKIVEDHCNPDDYALLDVVCTLSDARAALSTPPPEPPTDEELRQLWLNLYATNDGPTSGEVVVIARAVLERWG